MSTSEKKRRAFRVLQNAGILSPLRLLSLIQRQIAFFQLDLSNLTVLTEAASGPYVVTPVIASLAGARRVIAITRNSHYASANDVILQTRALETLCDVEIVSEIHTKRSLDLFSSADIVTNLGFVRPLDGHVISAMRQTAVIPLMCEAWEFRPGDVDLDACNTRGIPVVGTNENFPGLQVFSYSGFVCSKLLFEAQIEVHKSRIVIVGSDKFGVVIEKHLTQTGAEVRLVPDLRDLTPQDWYHVDALIIADYTRPDFIVGSTGDLSAAELARCAPALTVIQFAGKVDVEGLRENGLHVYPGRNLESHRMAVTLADLGPRPVVDLHTAGLKVGEMIYSARTTLHVSPSFHPRQMELAQILNLS